ncbi:MAG: dockerin type I domain-containing protein [Planctomycetota bacterium]|jgi:hypothetical protein
MKKFLIFMLSLCLAILLFASPAWSDVTISATQLHGCSDQVAISYVTDGNLPRAFGLDITVTDGIITACEPNMVGECTATVRGFGIFMGTIVIDANGTISDYGTPVAPSGAPGALGGLDTNGITIEMFSLYQEPNAPPLAGELCVITVTTDCNVNIEGNATRCGTEGVVMEDPDEVPTIVYIPGYMAVDCFCPGETIGDIYITQAIYNLWSSIGKPAIWCCEGNSKGDANDDGFTNPTDVGMIINALGQATTNANCAADLNRDGFINPTDVGQIINNLGVSHGGTCP